MFFLSERRRMYVVAGNKTVSGRRGGLAVEAPVGRADRAAPERRAVGEKALYHAVVERRCIPRRPVTAIHFKPRREINVTHHEHQIEDLPEKRDMLSDTVRTPYK